MFHAVLIIALMLKVRTSQGQQCTEVMSEPELSSNTITEIGQNVTLCCSSSQGSLPIDFMLFRGTQHVSSVKVEKGNKTAKFTLSVNNITDTGEYKCTAENNCTTVKKYSNGFNFTLVVSQPKLSSDNFFTVTGRNVTLFCFSWAGTLPITYRLFRSGMHLSNERVEVAEENGQFMISINSKSDIGEYKCTAENNFTTPKKYSNGINFTLVVPVSKPKLYTSATSTSMGQEVNLSCLSDYGSPPINYSFFRGGALLSFITKGDGLPAVLTLNLNSTTDLGTYQCKAENMLANMEGHSDGFNFTVGVETSSSLGLKIGIFILCLVVLALILAIFLWSLPKCQARKGASFKAAHVSPEKETGSTASKEFTKDPEGNTQDVEYTAVFVTNRRKVTEQEKDTVEYSEILIKNDTVEYSEILIKNDN